MYVINIKQVCGRIEQKMRFLPEYFYCQIPGDKAPIRVLVSGYCNSKRGVIRREFESRGFVVRYWQAKFNGYG